MLLGADIAGVCARSAVFIAIGREIFLHVSHGPNTPLNDKYSLPLVLLLFLFFSVHIPVVHMSFCAQVVPRPDAPVRLPLSYTDETRLLRSRAASDESNHPLGATPHSAAPHGADAMTTPVRPQSRSSDSLRPEVVLEDNEM